jgi:hypothetical protein
MLLNLFQRRLSNAPLVKSCAHQTGMKCWSAKRLPTNKANNTATIKVPQISAVSQLMTPLSIPATYFYARRH